MSGLWLALLGATAIFSEVPGAWGEALSIAIGTTDPFEAKGADVPAVALAVVSWLLVPAVVGTVAALLTERAIRQSRPLSNDDIRRLSEAWKRRVDDT